MYSKPLLRTYVNEGLHLKGWREKQLAEAMGMTPTNLSRALNQDGFNFTLQQFASLVQLLNLTSDQAFHILTGKKAKEANAQLLLSYAKKIIDGL
jgi:transcriptional regulator with XRE-family HTH domain